LEVEVNRFSGPVWGLAAGLALVVIVFFLVSEAALSDGRGRRHRDHGLKYLAPVDNPVYKRQCGACHFCYQPGLLPSGSWKKILAGLDKHFGRTVELDAGSRKTIAAYLAANAAEHSPARRARRIVRCLRGQTPIRITAIPYIRRRHRRLSAAVFKRPRVGSFSNCVACHTSAARGVYDDDDVRIPE
jgi:hypothetical protein